jgi:hypothetical protein
MSYLLGTLVGVGLREQGAAAAVGSAAVGSAAAGGRQGACSWEGHLGSKLSRSQTQVVSQSAPSY